MKRTVLILSLLLALLLPVQGWAAITEVGTKITDGWTSASSTPALTNYTTTTGSDKVIVAVIAAYTESGAVVSSYTFDGVAGVRVTSTNISSSGLISDIWIVKLGSHTGASKAQSIVFSANTESGFVTLFERDGVDQTTPGLHGLTANGSGAPTISVLTVAAGEYSIDGVTGFSGIGNATAGGTATHNEIRDELGGGGTAVYAGTNSIATGTVVMSWANDEGTWVGSAFSLAVAAGGGGPTGPPIGTLGLMGVGR